MGAEHVTRPLERDALPVPDRAESSGTAPCASWRVLAYLEGCEAEIRWCARRDGPCPYPGTLVARDAGAGQRCAFERGAAS